MIQLGIRCLFSALILLLLAKPAQAGMNYDPVLGMLKADRLEWQERDNFLLEAEAWLGRDIRKLWLELEWEKTSRDSGEGEVQLLYSHAISPFWNARAGMATGIGDSADNERAVLSLQGLAPYWFEMNLALLADSSGALEWRVQAEYELLLSQRLIISPELELSAYSGTADEEHGNGLAELETGIRLRYEIKREFAPYTGFYWKKEYGREEDHVSGWHWVIGVRFWF